MAKVKKSHLTFPPNLGLLYYDYLFIKLAHLGDCLAGGVSYYEDRLN